MSEQLLIENSEEGATFIQLERTEATTFYDSRYGAAVIFKVTKQRTNEHGQQVREDFEVIIRKNEWTELKRLVNEILKGK